MIGKKQQNNYSQALSASNSKKQIEIIPVQTVQEKEIISNPSIQMTQSSSTGNNLSACYSLYSSKTHSAENIQNTNFIEDNEKDDQIVNSFIL